jgi:hypothetical protein
MLSLKKRKHRKKTRRKIKKGGRGVRVYYVPIKEQPGTTKPELLYPIIEDIPLSKAYGKGKYVKNSNGDNIIPHFSESVSLTDFVPILDNGEEQFVFDMFSGIQPNQQVKQSTIYYHSRRDLQMIELYENIKNKYSEIDGLKLKLVMLLETDRRVSKKLNDMVNAMKTYIDAAAAAAAPDAAVNFKIQFGLPNDFDLEKLSMYESKILDKLYKEINDDSVKIIMGIINDRANAPPSHKYKLIYSENNDNTYDNIRYVILTLMLNTNILEYEAAPAPAPGAAANPGAAAVQGNNNQIPAIIAAIAAANPRAPAAAPAAPGDPLQAHALIAAIVAALARPVP